VEAKRTSRRKRKFDLRKTYLLSYFDRANILYWREDLTGLRKNNENQSLTIQFAGDFFF